MFHKSNPEFVPRSSWKMPDVKTGLDHKSINDNGLSWIEGGEPDRCSKKRKMVIGHRSRTGLWIVSCLKCNRVVGYHIMKHSEGRRDCLLPIYRFKKVPPKVIMVDFGCMAEESGLNWIPHYVRDTQFLIDVLHKFGHKCSEHFGSRHLIGLCTDNTSLAEQVNSFLQTIRGIIGAASTNVSTYFS